MQTRDAGGSMTDAPPKQVALAMDRLGNAARLVADIRLGGDRLLEAMFVSTQSNKPLNLFLKEDAAIRQHLQELRAIGRQLEESGVVSESFRSRSNSWGLHMPLVCPDGAVVAYAWKRQLAGQAGASAVDKTRLALKAFTDQKRRFFPHLDDGESGGAEPISKKQYNHPVSTTITEQEDCKTLSQVIMQFEKQVPRVKVSTYQRLDWFKLASSNKLKSGLAEDDDDDDNDDTDADKIGVIELLFPTVFRAVISLHPAGSIHPDAIALFSPDEEGSYIQARGVSVFDLFKQITDHAGIALEYLVGIKSETALYLLLRWICTYESIFKKVCSKCGRLLLMNKEKAKVQPPVIRPYRLVYGNGNSTSTQAEAANLCYHVDCFSEES